MKDITLPIPVYKTAKTVKPGVSKNADSAHYFLPYFWTLEKLSEMPAINGLQDIMRGQKSGKEKLPI